MLWVSLRPAYFQVFPASVDLKTPAPNVELWRLFASPVPTYTTSGFDGAIAMSPIDATGCSSKTGVKVVPLFVVFQTPPVAKPT